MKIATFNVNSVNARLPVLLRWLAESQPDIACLQELKTPQENFPHAALRQAGYHAIWHGQKAWNGVAILARMGEPMETGRGLAGDPDDVHSRYLEGEVGEVRVGCLYLPNGNPVPGPKFDYKLRWLERFTARASELVSLPGPVVLAGDYNVIPEERDVYDPAGWSADALFRPESREAYSRLLAQGWTDALRHLNPDGRVYTFWDYTSGAWRRNAGLRIDHLLLNPAAATRLTAAGVDKHVRGWEKTSDHAPTWIALRDEQPGHSVRASLPAGVLFGHARERDQILVKGSVCGTGHKGSAPLARRSPGGTSSQFDQPFVPSLAPDTSRAGSTRCNFRQTHSEHNPLSTTVFLI